MGIIKVLDEYVSNAIAAGEVVENPSSMIKELLENSLDAKSKNININVKQGGLYVEITDDGKGMVKEDLLLSIERHATSKIFTKDDLFNITTYGFRGEALSSIVSVSKANLSSKVDGAENGTSITVTGGKVTSIKEIHKNTGTRIEIRDLFFNTPARLKFLRKSTTEYMNIKDIVIREALANTDVRIRLTLDGKESIRTTGRGIENCILEIFGKDTLKHSTQFSLGYLGNAKLYRSNKDSIFIFVNGRPVKSQVVEAAIIDAYYTKLMKGKYPFAIIFLEVDPKEIDVNVHPSKKILKFSNHAEIYSLVKKEIDQTFSELDDFMTASLDIKSKTQSDDSLFSSNKDETDFQIKNDDNHDNFTPIKSENLSFDNIASENNFYNDNSVHHNEKSKSELDIEMDSFINPNKTNLDHTQNNTYNKSESIYTKESVYKETENKEFLDNDSNSDKKILSEIHEKTNEFNSDLNNKKENQNSDNSFIKQTQKSNSYDFNFRIIGQIYDTFILSERDGIFEIYDQHAVHERILYEKFKKLCLSNEIPKQQLLVPIRISIDPREKHLVFENLDSFNFFGFEIDDFSENEILLRSVPAMNFKESNENLLRNIIHILNTNKINDIREDMIITMSCKGAIKANDKLTIHEMELLIQELHNVGEYTCPHGRPVILKITLNDLEKLFKRK